MAERVISATAPYRLEMRDICKSFRATVALYNVCLKVPPGQVHALVGENGAGKSTLMKVFSGAVLPDTGWMLLDGKHYSPRSPLDARNAGVVMVYQELSLAPHLTVEDNIILGMEPGKLGLINRRKARRLVNEALKFFEHPEIRPDVPVRYLSVAAQQLVELARGLAIGGKVLILDEPTSSLGQADVERLFRLIRMLKKQGYAIIYISHFIEEVQKIADEVTVLRDGKTIATHNIADVTTEKIVSEMVGRDVKNLYPRSYRKAGEELLCIENLAGLTVLASANLTLHRGEVLGIAGLVGAGRTELLRCLFGLDKVRSGQIRVGLYTGPASPVTRWRQGLGFLSEARKEESLALAMNIADNITLSKLRGLGRFGLLLPHKQKQAAARWIAALGIRCLGPGQLVNDLSGGNQQKVAFARLLHHDVDVLILDEPTRGIDVGAKATIYKLIDRLALGTDKENRSPKAILMVSSYLPELLGVCDRVAVMVRGRLGPIHKIDEIDEHSLMLEAIGQAAS